MKKFVTSELINLSLPVGNQDSKILDDILKKVYEKAEEQSLEADIQLSTYMVPDEHKENTFNQMHTMLVQLFKVD